VKAKKEKDGAAKAKPARAKKVAAGVAADKAESDE
jgi:hypothetical protein